MERILEIGVVGRPHGVDGKLHIHLRNPESTALMDTNRLYVDLGQGLECHRILDIREGPQCLLARLQGIADRDQAERVKGAKIYVARADLPDTAPDEFYVADIMGLKAWHGGVCIGEISSSRPVGGIEVVTVEGDGFSVEIPMVDDFVERLDIPMGEVRFRNIESLPRSPRKRKPDKGK